MQKYKYLAHAALILFIGFAWAAFKVPARKPGTEIKVLVIDAGHGGYDHGCMYGGANEKDITLSISNKLGKLISDSFKNIKVIYIRQSDSFVELHERAEIANKNNADFFLSVHVNASTSPSAYGTETYAMGLHKTAGNLSVAKRENASILLENDYKSNYDGFDPSSAEGHIIFSLYQNQFLKRSLDMAAQVEQNFKKLNRYSRGVKQAGFLVLWKTSMPSVLVETGYLSNHIERKYLTSCSGQDSTAMGIFRAFIGYKNMVEGRK
ncbi:MAG: N-acetylmuramoyl-L-alanine amidase [Bacteroidota bacterium]|nr:N-acetylmuramoyl-L-alanine amidase [Bacteroidota bacterium]